MARTRRLLAPLAVAALVLARRRQDETGSDGTGPAGRAPQGAPGAGSAGSGGEPRRSASAGGPGGGADRPTQIPAAGWRAILVRAWQETKDDNVPLLAAGVAFYAFLALFPALIAAVTVYGLVADPAQVEAQIASFTRALPQDTASVITGQLRSLAAGSSSALSFGLVASLLGGLWTASSGMSNLMKATNLAYDEEETRGFVKLRAVALALTLGAVLFLVVAAALVAVLPAVLGAVGLGGFTRVLIEVGRWIGLVVFVLAALALLYRYAPDRDHPRFAWTSVGAVAATVLWVLGSAGFSLYVSTFGSYGKTYGALAGVAVLLLWLFLTSFMVLLGAEINSEMEHQTAQDTTRGEAKPMGERNAVMADTVAG